jgi:O-antigen/teichoic acid export membrane protein
MSNYINEGVDVWVSKLRTYALPFAKWGLLGWGQIFSERFFLQTNSSIETVAHFAVLYQIGYQSIILFDNIITQVATPILYQMAGAGISKSRLTAYSSAILRLIIVKLIFYSFIALLILYNSEFIVISLTGPIYMKYIDYLPLLAIAAILFIIAQTATLIVVAQLETNLLLAPKVYTALIAIACNYVLSFYFELLGTLFALVIFSILYLIWIARLSVQKLSRLSSNEIN